MTRRPQHRLRLTTWLILAGVAAALAIYNLRGRDQPSEVRQTRSKSSALPWPDSPVGGPDLQAGYAYGWPLTYLRLPRYLSQLDFKTYSIRSMPRWLTGRVWRQCFHRAAQTSPAPLPDFSTTVLVIDVLTAILVLTATGRLTDRWLREQLRPFRPRWPQWPKWSSPFQYGLHTLLLLPVVLGMFLAFICVDVTTPGRRIERMVGLLVVSIGVGFLWIIRWSKKQVSPLRSALQGLLVLSVVTGAMFAAVLAKPALMITAEGICLWLLLLAAVVGGFYLVKWIKSTPRTHPWYLRLFASCSVIGAIMFAAALSDSSLFRFPFGYLVWSLSALVGYGVLCTLWVIALKVAELFRRVWHRE